MIAFGLASDDLSVNLVAYDRFAVFEILIAILKGVTVAILNQLSLELPILGVEIIDGIQENLFRYNLIGIERNRILRTVS